MGAGVKCSACGRGGPSRRVLVMGRAGALCAECVRTKVSPFSEAQGVECDGCAGQDPSAQRYPPSHTVKTAFGPAESIQLCEVCLELIQLVHKDPQ